MINIVLCDDESFFLIYMKEKISQCISNSSFTDFNYNIAVFTDSSKAMQYCSENEIHIAFIDIDMPIINGFDIAEFFKLKKADTKIIFVSNYDNLVYSSIKFRPFRFIKKSIFEDEIEEAVNSALNELIIEGSYWNMGKRNNFERVLLSEIIYIESHKNDLIFHCVNNKYVVRDTLTNAELNLSKYHFIRIHVGIIVNIKYIKNWTNTTIFLTNNVKLPISRQNRDKLNDLQATFLLQ